MAVALYPGSADAFDNRPRSCGPFARCLLLASLDWIIAPIETILAEDVLSVLHWFPPSTSSVDTGALPHPRPSATMPVPWNLSFRLDDQSIRCLAGAHRLIAYETVLWAPGTQPIISAFALVLARFWSCACNPSIVSPRCPPRLGSDDILAHQDATAYRQVASFISISLYSLLRLLPQPFFIADVLDEPVIQHHACIYWCHCLSSLYGASRPSARVFSGLCLPYATASPSPAIVMMLVHEPMTIQDVPNVDMSCVCRTDCLLRLHTDASIFDY
ncbi:hypothetical protein B0H11DRAFT_2256139 [Mycena galericulata]|nr:hypothetical protein B0H11DRAFT_2256139 [Mycena galericulata]